MAREPDVNEIAHRLVAESVGDEPRTKSPFEYVRNGETVSLAVA